MLEAAHKWTEERIAVLTRMWSEGQSASKIAAALGEGCTRNSVISKVHRLKLAGHGRNDPPKQKKLKKSPTKAAAAARRGSGTVAFKIGQARKEGLSGADAMEAVLGRPSAEIVEEVEEGVDVTRLLGLTQLNEHTCRWPIGDPRQPDFGFCGEHPRENSRYCGKHHRRAHI